MTAPAISPERPAIGARRRAARKAAGLTQTQAGAHLGITGSAISDFERGASAYPLERLSILAALYGVPLASLYSDAPAQNGHAPSVVLPPPDADETLDPELEGMIACFEGLAPLDTEARRRVVHWARGRFGLTLTCPTCHKEF